MSTSLSLNVTFTFAPARFALIICLALLSTGCAGVKVHSINNEDYLATRRGDVLTTGQLSSSSVAGMQVLGLEQKYCNKHPAPCREQLKQTNAVEQEVRLAALSELWLAEALQNPKAAPALRIDAYLQSARYAYAYLFYTERTTGERALEERQTQVRDYYNFSVQEALVLLFDYYKKHPPQSSADGSRYRLQIGDWNIRGTMQSIRLAEGQTLPQELVPAASLSFAGLRNQYRRDGLGAEMVAVTRKRVVNSKSDEQPWSETPFPAISMVIRFPGRTLEDVLNTQTAIITGHDPYRTSSVRMGRDEVPLAANFTSGYGLWLARSGFARQSLLTLIGKGEVLESPHVYMLQPYDPNRKVLVMLHGLASSPEAWINVANEVLGDEKLRNQYQIWQVYYPTNHPISLNQKALRESLEATLRHFDPDGTAAASQDMVLLGHSMGGVISRLLVTNTGDQLRDTLLDEFQISRKRQRLARAQVDPYLKFEAMPQVSRAIFVAAPHRGTPFAENRLSRWASKLISLPLSVADRLTELTKVVVDPNSASPVALTRGFNSIDNLSNQDPFIRASAELPIDPRVQYHSIIGNNTPKLSLQASNDGVVPYQSSHLAGADSELVLPSWHSVQETPDAIIEIRRILHEHLSTLEAQ